MKKISNFIKIPLVIFSIAWLICAILFSVDSTLIIFLALLLGSFLFIFVNDCISKYIKAALFVIIVLLMLWIIHHSFYLIVATILSTLLSSIILIIIDKDISKILKITLSTIQILIICWITVIMIDWNRMNNIKEPLFAKNISSTNNISIYKGFGYKIEFKYYNGHFEKGTIYILSHDFGMVIS
jgi:hypothetical protein